MRKAAFLLLAVLLTAAPTVAQTVANDSDTTAVTAVASVPQSVETDSATACASRMRRFDARAALVGVPLVAGGLIVKGEDTRFRHLRNDYLPEFNRHLDDYLQFSPLAALLALKAAGVESRSTWGRMLSADAASAVIMAAVVNTLKTTTQVERPDGSNRHSFPSGHTATAFMTATMLAKEYGHKSPWIGVGAYTVASATGLMRMANNKHWLSDVMTGAGIGILSTELGYWLTDLVFKDKGLRDTYSAERFLPLDRPSFLGLYLGMNIPLSGYDISEGDEMATSSGSVAGVEGAYFLSPYVGVGGRFTVSNTAIIVNGDEAAANTFDAVALMGGAYFSLPLTARWQLGSKLLGGYIHYPRLDLAHRSVPARSGLSLGSGLNLTFRARGHYAMRLFLDYNLQPSHSRQSGEWMNTLTLGTSFAITL